MAINTSIFNTEQALPDASADIYSPLSIFNRPKPPEAPNLQAFVDYYSANPQSSNFKPTQYSATGTTASGVPLSFVGEWADESTIPNAQNQYFQNAAKSYGFDPSKFNTGVYKSADWWNSPDAYNLYKMSQGIGNQVAADQATADDDGFLGMGDLGTALMLGAGLYFGMPYLSEALGAGAGVLGAGEGLTAAEMLAAQEAGFGAADLAAWGGATTGGGLAGLGSYGIGSGVDTIPGFASMSPTQQAAFQGLMNSGVPTGTAMEAVMGSGATSGGLSSLFSNMTSNPFSTAKNVYSAANALGGSGGTSPTGSTGGSNMGALLTGGALGALLAGSGGSGGSSGAGQQTGGGVGGNFGGYNMAPLNRTADFSGIDYANYGAGPAHQFFNPVNPPVQNFAEGGKVKGYIDEPSVMGFLNYLWNKNKLPSEIRDEQVRQMIMDASKPNTLQPLPQQPPQPIQPQGGLSNIREYGLGLQRQKQIEDLLDQASGDVQEKAQGGLANLVKGGGGGQDDMVPARLSPGEYVMDAATVSDLGDGSTEAGAKKLDQMRQNIRNHKRTGGKFPPKAKHPLGYLKGA